MDGEHSARYKAFLLVAWAFVAYNVLGTIIGSLAALPVSNGQHGNVHTVGSQAIFGNGAAVSPPLFVTAIVALFVLAATRQGWLGRVGGAVTFLFAGFYLTAGKIGELTTSTSPLTGAKWDLVLVLGSIGLSLAAAVLLAGPWTLAGALRSRRAHPLRVEGASRTA